MLGRFEEARAILGEERASQAERGRGIVLAGALGFDSVELEPWPATMPEVLRAAQIS